MVNIITAATAPRTAFNKGTCLLGITVYKIVNDIISKVKINISIIVWLKIKNFPEKNGNDPSKEVRKKLTPTSKGARIKMLQ